MKLQRGLLLYQSGYAIISRRHKIAARIDRSNWNDIAIKKYYYLNPQERADMYRRLMTKDSIHVTREEMKFLPSSINGQLGYVPKVEGYEPQNRNQSRANN